MNALIKGNQVIQVSKSKFEVHPDYIWINCPDDCTTQWTYIDKILIPPPIVVPTAEEILKEYQDAIQLALDNKAREKMYSNALSIATYVTSTNHAWQADALAFIAWRDAVYVYALKILDNVRNGGKQPTIADFVAAIPMMVWPN